MKIYLVLLFSLIPLTSFGQTSMYHFAKNELKYWKLRGRLIGDDNNKDVYNGFITVGEGKGLSIPAAVKHSSYIRQYFDFHPFQDGDCKLQTINSVPIFAEYDANGNLTSGQPLIDPRDGKELKGILKFSDNSLINLGMYISVLATEWALLKRSNADRTQTEMELYYALKALDRLDLAGENFYSNTPQLNGFLMRNDADEFFQLNTNGKNIDIVNTSIACKRTLSPLSAVLQTACELIEVINNFNDIA